MLTKVSPWVYLNGKYVKKENAAISAFDRGFLFGDCLVETMRSYFLRVPFIDEHFNRLRAGLDRLQIHVPLDLAGFSSIVYTLLNRNRSNAVCVRFSVSRGEGAEITVHEKTTAPATVFCFLREIPEALTPMHNLGIRLIVSAPARGWEDAYQVKSSCLLQSVLGRMDCRRQGADDILFLDVEGHVTETTASNVFCVRDGSLYTPPAGRNVIAGVTRGCILEAAYRHKIPVFEQPLTPGELLAADEVFIANSVIEVIPVVRIDQTLVGAGKPGVTTRFLHEAYRRMVEEEITREP